MSIPSELQARILPLTVSPLSRDYLMVVELGVASGLWTKGTCYRVFALYFPANVMLFVSVPISQLASAVYRLLVSRLMKASLIPF